MKIIREFIAGGFAALLLVAIATLVVFAQAGCVSTSVELPNGGGKYHRTSFLSTQSAGKVEVQLGPDKKVTIDNYGTNSTDLAAQALALANKIAK